MADEPRAPGESDPVDEPDRERRLGEVLAGYFAAVEAGTGPTPEELIAQHPDLAGDLEGYFADKERFECLVAPLRPVTRAALAEAATQAAAEANMPPSQFQPTEPVAARALVERQGLIPGGNAATLDQPVDPGPGEGAEVDADLPRGTRLRYFGDYELLSILGRGGMGVVYRARQVSLNRPVALKMLKAGVLAGDDELRRFQNEAEAIALLDHPGIVPVYENGEHEGQKYFSMKLVLGGSLAERLKSYKADPKATASLLAEVADAVHHAHMRGILHRDLKPTNILIDAEGHGHVTDFGLAKRVEADVEMTASGAVLGTPAYMAPEQATGRRGAITTATDVHGLGSVFYALLTGQAPFAADSVVDTLTKVKELPPAPPRRLNARVPRDLEVICLRCLEKDPRRRYANAQAVADDLRAWLENRPIVARPASRVEKAVKWARRRPAVALLSALVVLLSLIGVGGILSQWREAVVARQAAVEKAQAEAKARAEATHLAVSLQGQTYSLALALAQREWEAANIAQVQRLLDLCAPRLRGWEWQRLRYLCHLDERTISAPGNHAGSTFLSWSPDGTRLVSLRASKERPGGGWNNEDYDEHAQIIHVPHEDRPAVLVPGVRKAAWEPLGQQLLVYRKDESLARVEADTSAVSRLWSLPVARLGVWDVAWSPDGRRVAVARSSGLGSNLRVWDAQTGQGERVLTGHQEQVYAVAWSPGSKRLASASEDGTIRVWDPDTGASVLTLTGHAGAVKAVAWSPDGNRLATGSQDQSARIWDAQTGHMIAVLGGHGGYVNAVAWRPDGSSLATASDDRTIRLWDPGTGKPLSIFRGHADRVFQLTWKPDGSRLASISGDQTIKIWDPFHARESLDLEGHPAGVLALGWSPDSQFVASAGNDPVVRLWDAATGRLIRKLDGHSDHVYSLSFSPDGKRLATTSRDATAKVWNVATGAVVSTFKKNEEHILAVAWSPDSQLVATGGSDRVLRIWDPGTGTERLSVQATSNPDKGAISGVAWSPDGSRIALGLTLPDQTVLVLDASTGRTLLTLSGHTHAISAVAWSHDSQFLASSSYDKTCRVWEATTGAPRATLIGHGGFVFSATWNHDGTRLATAGGDGTIKVWNSSDGAEVLTLAGHTGNIWSVAWSPDGASLASAGADRRVRIWRSRAAVAR
jgi:WD40 repeat protein